MSNVTINQLPAASTIDPVQDLLPIYTANVQATQSISRNTYLGITGSPVGTSDSQSLGNKAIGNTNTLTVKDSNFTLQNSSSITKQVQFSAVSITAGQTRVFTLPDLSDTLVTLTATQTLTNKTLTNPTLNSPILSNATISADAITGFTVSNTGSIYGISITAGVITTANSVQGGALTNSSVTPNKLATGATFASVLTSETTTSMTYADLATTTDSVTVTVGVNGILQVGIYCSLKNSSTNYSNMSFALSGSNTQAASDAFALSINGTSFGAYGATFTLTGLTPGSTTVKAKYDVSGGTGTFLNRRISALPL